MHIAQENKNDVSNLFLLIPYLEAEFVNAKFNQFVPGPGSHNPRDSYVSVINTSQSWSINKIDKNKKQKLPAHPGP